MTMKDENARLARKTTQITGIVRHYHKPNSDHTPYRGQLKTDDDDSNLCIERYGREEVLSLVSQLLSDFEDGEEVIITVKGFGTHVNADGFEWMLVAPHTYKRVKK